jgi:mRNA-degrading endonuclease RelE of RelBE toxin-antitoxin system
MKLLETSKFKKLRKKVESTHEREALKEAVEKIMEDPDAGKLLKGEFRDLRSFKYSVKGQSKRLIYKIEEDILILFSFGPREGIYK